MTYTYLCTYNRYIQSTKYLIKVFVCASSASSAAGTRNDISAVEFFQQIYYYLGRKGEASLNNSHAKPIKANKFFLISALISK